jgi:uncharacterized membrane protein YedE/YeeE
MNADIDTTAIARTVVLGGFVLGLALGAVGQATRFCVRGAIADWVIFRGPARMVAWFVAVATAAVALQALIGTGQFDAGRTLPWSDRLVWLSALVGGVLFGWGMVLSHGCPQRCLVKAGSGNLRAAVTLLVIAVAAAMTLRGLFAAPRANGLDSVAIALGGSQDIGSLLNRALGAPAQMLRWLVALAMAGGAAWFAWRVRKSLHVGHWAGGIAVGLMVAAAFYLTGHVGFVAEHPETLEPAWLGTQSRRPEGLSFSAPMAHLLDLVTLWTDKAMVPTFAAMLALGVVVGSFVSAKWRGEFRLETFTSPKDLGAHVSGGLLMGFGGVTALGCSVGNGVTGMAMLSTGALIATAGIALGAWLALKRQVRGAETGAARPVQATSA